MNDRHRFILALFVLLGTVAYGIYAWNERSALLLEVNALQDESRTLTAISKSLADDYQDIKVEVSSTRETASQELARVFPTSEDLTALTRLFDDFAVKNNFESNPFFVDRIAYGQVMEVEGKSYRYIPVEMTVESSKKNLSKFMEFIESSGALEGETRLLSIENMSITYPAEYGGVYEARIDLNAYFSQEL